MAQSEGSPATTGRLARRALLGSALVGGATAGALFAPGAALAAPTGWKVFFVEHPGGTPTQSGIQAALTEAHAAGGGHVVVGPGTWQVTSPLRIWANTRLTLTPATVLRRTGAVNAMLRNGDSSDTSTGYNGAGNIIVEGGVWDANADSVPTPGWAIVFAHARNITVRDLEIRDVSEWHAIELNSTADALVQNCTFVGARVRPSAAWNQEAVSFDLAAPGLVPFGAADNTQCRGIRIIDNRCTGWPTFAGCHTGLATSGHEEVVISGNSVRDLTAWGVSLRNTSRAVVTDNTMLNVGGGVMIRCHDDATARRSLTSVVVADNVIDTTTVDEGIRLTGANGGSAGDGQVWCTSVSGNVLRRTAGSGISAVWAPEVQIRDNSIHVSGKHGVEAINCTSATLSGNLTRDAQWAGISINGGGDHRITDNSVLNAARATDQARDAIQLLGVTSSMVQGNKVASANPAPRYAISADSASSGVLCVHNDLRTSYQDAALNLAGSGHITSMTGNVS
ncbi:right-handed parallel beta-helix repeat-containing protein [Micromonospora sp. NPDC003197]